MSLLGEKKDYCRESSYEFFRLSSIFFIIMMHSLGPIVSEVSGFNLFYTLVIGDIGNIGVSYFALLSGYFGVKAYKFKVLSIHKRLLFYSVLGLLLMWCFSRNDCTTTYILSSIFPYASRKNWYITCYLALLIISPFIEEIFLCVDREKIKHLVFGLLLILSVIPTLFFFFGDIMGDGGKGLIWILFLYFVGGCYRRGIFKRWTLKWSVIVFILCQALCFIGNSLSIFIYKSFKAPFARDLSILTLVSALSLLNAASNIKVKNKIVNYISLSVIGVYLFEGTIRTVLRKTNVLDIDINNLIISNLCVSLTAFLISLIVDFAYRLLFSNGMDSLSKKELEMLKQFIEAKK